MHTPTNRVDDAPAFTHALLEWFAAHQRTLPWRNGYDPYHVWVSEVMLQQTQMERGVAYFTRWMERFPDVHALAAAEEDEVLSYWEGLGYYSRARNLHRAAGVIAREHGGEVPATRKDLLALPGVGPYTAGAVLSIAHGQDEPLVDANVERVFSRVLNIEVPVKEKAARQRIADTARELLPPGHAREYNQALMELGALVCRKKPLCERCPVTEHCDAFRLGVQHERPVTGTRATSIRIRMATGVLVHEGRIYLQRRMPDDIWGGLWEFPGGVVEDGEEPDAALVREFAEETGFSINDVEPVASLRHAYTRYQVRLSCYLCGLATASHAVAHAPTLTAATAHVWVRPHQLADYALPSPMRTLVTRLAGDMRLMARLS